MNAGAVRGVFIILGQILQMGKDLLTLLHSSSLYFLSTPFNIRACWLFINRLSRTPDRPLFIVIILLLIIVLSL